MCSLAVRRQHPRLTFAAFTIGAASSLVALAALREFASVSAFCGSIRYDHSRIHHRAVASATTAQGSEKMLRVDVYSDIA